MRRDTTHETVRWTAKVSAEEFERFESLLPINGAVTAAVTIGLRSFLNQLEQDPMLQVRAHEDLANHIYVEQRQGRTIQLDIRVPTSLYIRFNTLIPEYGGATWFIRRFIQNLNITMKEDIIGTQINAAIERLLAPPPVYGTANNQTEA